MPSTEIELGHCYEALDRVVDFGKRKQCFGMCHETFWQSAPIQQRVYRNTLSHFVIRSSIDRGSSIKVGSVTRLRSAPGRSCDIMCESTAIQSH